MLILVFYVVRSLDASSTFCKNSAEVRELRWFGKGGEDVCYEVPVEPRSILSTSSPPMNVQGVYQLPQWETITIQT